jgi:cell division protein FtsZ
MNRREFLKLILLAGGVSAALPATAILNAASVDPWPLIDSDNPRNFAVAGQVSDGGFPKIGVVAAGSGACGILGQWQGKLPHLARRVAIDTSPFALYRTMADHYVWVGRSNDQATDPNTVRLQAKTAKPEIRDALQGLDLIWLLSSLGSAAATGIAPTVADIAKELGIPVIAASITPFAFEGTRRSQVARAGFNAITRRVAASIELPNEAFIKNPTDDERLDLVLGRAGNEFEHLYSTTSSILSQPGLIGVDLEDFRTAMAQGQGLFAFGYGIGHRQNALNDAFTTATSHILLGAERLRNAKGAFVAIHLKSEHEAMSQINEVMRSVSAALSDPGALVIYSAVVDPGLYSDASVSILAAL